MRTNGTRSPSETRNSATVVRFSPRVSTGVVRERVGAANCEESTVRPGDPGDEMAVVETDGEIPAHAHTAAHSLDDPDQVGVVATVPTPNRHVVDDPNGPSTVDLHLGLEDEGARPVLASDCLGCPVGTDPPPSAVLVAEQGGQT